MSDRWYAIPKCLKKGDKMAGYAQEHIYYTLRNLLCEYELDDIKVSNIVERGRINRKTFYYHFHGIEDLLKWCISKKLSEINLNDADESNWKEKMGELVCLIESQKDFFIQLFISKYSVSINGYLCLKLRPYIVKFTENCIKTAELTRGAPIIIERRYFEYIVDYYLKGIMSLVEEWIQRKCTESPKEFLDIIDNLTKNTIFNVIDAFYPQ